MISFDFSVGFSNEYDFLRNFSLNFLLKFYFIAFTESLTFSSMQKMLTSETSSMEFHLIRNLSFPTKFSWISRFSSKSSSSSCRRKIPFTFSFLFAKMKNFPWQLRQALTCEILKTSSSSTNLTLSIRSMSKIFPWVVWMKALSYLLFKTNMFG